MSARLRVTLWVTLMMLMMSAMMLVFILVINGKAVTDDPAGWLVKVTQNNANDVEFDRGSFDWDDLDVYKRGVYCAYYSMDGSQLYGAMPEEWVVDAPFVANILRTEDTQSGQIYVYDIFVDMEFTGLWVRGAISAEPGSGVMRVVIILMCTLLPVLLLLSIGGGWLIAWSVFRPMEKIVDAANVISDGDDMSRRVNMRKGPREMKRLAAAFDKMLSRLEKSFISERQFASDASHELRTPITVILAECDRARRKNETREDFLASIAVIEEQGRGMSELVQSLLSLTRMQQGTDRYPMRRANLSEFIESCCGEFIPAEARGIHLETDIAPDIECEYNHALMSRVVQNLLQNAYKYGRQNGNIAVKLCTERNNAVLTVSDDGIGIAKEDQERIWQRFWQADASRGEDGGSGLGLAMVKEITEFHGGSVAVESEPGVGSTFTVTLPGTGDV